jgi:flavin reductase (DIM6/NTAB) family NADH-FMN oxidoreductase RutF
MNADLNSAYLSLDASELSPTEAYATLLHCVAPRPIAFVSSIALDGTPNLAPFSFFMAGGANPPSVVISPTTRPDGTKKHTQSNIEATGEYVINIVTREIAEQMNQTSADYPEGVSEWNPSGLTPAESVKVKPARVAESPLSIECKLHTIIHHGEGPGSANYIIGEVVHFHIRKDLLREDGRIDARRVGYVARMGGSWYSHAVPDAMFELERPKQP